MRGARFALVGLRSRRRGILGLSLDWALPVPPRADPGGTITAMNPLSGVLDEAWRMYKKFAAHLLAIAFVIYLGAAIIAGLLALAGTVGFWLGFVVAIVAAFLLQATLVKAVQDVRDGRADLSCPSARPCPRPCPTSGPSPEHRSWPASGSRSGCSS